MSELRKEFVGRQFYAKVSVLLCKIFSQNSFVCNFLMFGKRFYLQHGAYMYFVDNYASQNCEFKMQ